MPHPFAGGSCASSNKGYYRFGEMLLDILRGLFFVCATYLSNQDYCLGCPVGLERLQTVNEIGSGYLITTDTYTG